MVHALWFPGVITLIGTGHVFDLRTRLQREVMQRSPDVVCLELDHPRLQALLARKRGVKGQAQAPMAYRLLADFQDRMAADRGIMPGDEMLAAFEVAQVAQVPVALIDMDAQKAFATLWARMGLVEKARFLGSAALGAILPKRFMEKEIEQLQSGDFSQLLEQLGKDYPTVKAVLIDERNVHMASRLEVLQTQGKERIVAVVGDGHVEGMQALLRGKGAMVEAVRLRDLQAGAVPAPQGTASWSFSTQSGP